jgi:hypothetical protein
MTIINVFQSHDQNIVVLVEHSILHFVYLVIVFNFYLRKIVLQEVGGEIIFKRELIWNEWFIFIFIDIYNN